mgnify:CR=1 FL=1
MFGLAIVITTTNLTTQGSGLPRLTTLPTLRVQPHPEMTELITMTVELEPEETLPGKSDRRSAKTAYAALKALETRTSSAPYVDVDESSDYIFVLQASKKIVHSSDQQPKVVADLVIAVKATT